MKSGSESDQDVVTTREISSKDLLRDVADSGAGATVLFLGTVRDFGDLGSVSEITYKAYVPLARKSLADIRNEMMRRWPLKKARIVHRIGTLGLEEISVAIAVSSSHRQAAFEACRFAIESIKQATPIWKKERLSKGTEAWVAGEKIASVKPFDVQ